MIAKVSPLKWINFALLQSKFEFINPGLKKKIIPQTYFDKYEVDIDFSFKEDKEKMIQVFLLLGVNNVEKSLPGYKIIVEATGVFQLMLEDKISEGEINNLKYYSTVNLLINKSRSHIHYMTSLSVFESYDLPPINIGDLFVQKAKLNR